MSLATAERAAICAEFATVGPDQPTLCGDWSTHDLLAHLLVRERKPWAAPGILVPALAPITDKAMRGYAATPWADMVAELRGGAPIWSPYWIGAVDALANGAEFFVHHEDVRRALPGWSSRPPDAERDAEVWTVLTRMARILYRGSPVGVTLRIPDGRSRVAKAGIGVTLVGEPGELLLHAFGRAAVHVDIEGGAADVAGFEEAARGF